MDTDDLSKEAYRAVILEAEMLTRDLTVHFGVLASSCKAESEYFEKAKLLINRIKGFNEFELDELLFGNVPNQVQLNLTLSNMLDNIESVEKMPLNKRYYDF